MNQTGTKLDQLWTRKRSEACYLCQILVILILVPVIHLGGVQFCTHVYCSLTKTQVIHSWRAVNWRIYWWTNIQLFKMCLLVVAGLNSHRLSRLHPYIQRLWTPRNTSHAPEQGSKHHTTVPLFRPPADQWLCSKQPFLGVAQTLVHVWKAHRDCRKVARWNNLSLVWVAGRQARHGASCKVGI